MGDTMTTSDPSRPIDPGVRIGHVHLKVADLERALRFYCGVLGFELTFQRRVVGHRTVMEFDGVLFRASS